MKELNRQKPPFPFFLIAIISANVGIIISLMHLVFHFIDLVNFSVAFLDSEVTNVLMIVLSVSSFIASICVLMFLHREKNKSYFFRKVAFITFWICFINVLIQCNVIFPEAVEKNYRNAVWFFMSSFTLINSIFCNGLFCMEHKGELEANEALEIAEE